MVGVKGNLASSDNGGVIVRVASDGRVIQNPLPPANFVNSNEFIEVHFAKASRFSSLSFILEGVPTNYVQQLWLRTSMDRNDWTVLFNCSSKASQINMLANQNTHTILLRFPKVRARYSMFKNPNCP